MLNWILAMKGKFKKTKLGSHYKKLTRAPVRLYKTNRALFVLLAVAVITIIITSISVGLGLRNNSTSSGGPSLKVVKNLPFDSLVPKNKSIDELGGWRQVSPPDSEPVFAYTDSIGDIQIIVSQQELPKNLRKDKDVAELAEKFNATNKLKTQGSIAYIGRSAKGPQSVIVAKEDVLVLIKSKGTIDDSAWVKYISLLD